MNKTVSVNISGFIFNIEEEAYAALKNYLDAIRKTFSGTEGSEEIMADIEARIAELFQEKLNDRKQVIIPADVKEVITVMGEPEVFRDDEAGPESAPGAQPEGDRSERNANRRLFRDPDDVVLGGVASGVSHYITVDPVYVRLAFVLLAILSFGTAAIIYIILWAVVPEAASTAEKLKMRGQDVTLENIRQHINEEMAQVNETIKNAAGKGGNSFKQFVEKAFSGLGDLIHGFGKVLVKLIGLFMLFLGTSMLIAGIIALFAADTARTVAGDLSLSAIDEVFLQDQGLLPLIVIAMFLIILPPIIGLIYGGIRLLLNLKHRLKGLGITLLFMCIAGFILAFYIGSRIGTEFSHEHEKSAIIPLSTSSDTLYFEVMPDLHFHDELRKDDAEFFDMFKLSETHIVLGEPVSVYFRNAGTAGPEVEILRHSQVPLQQEAIRLASEIDYSYEITDSLIRLSPVMKIPRANHFHGERVEIIIRVPEGKKIHFSQNSSRLLYQEKYRGKVMTMGPDGLHNPANAE